MPRIAMDAFEEGEEIVRVYLAASVDEAQAVERALDAAGFEYGVEVETFAARSAFGSGAPRSGAGFWVIEDDLEAIAAALARAGLRRGLVERPSP
jgi:hypothetical protein